ncbi:hypothetical protein [Maridesulfovibrio zosterae]|uniref:hypothetical protein n=1 Tax=Maridesulfovibrio zosterae TaxID=82171 RepID=UPI0003F688F1|nr:hypothetical protein [Maridesulfovibrio zosterae]
MDFIMVHCPFCSFKQDIQLKKYDHDSVIKCFNCEGWFSVKFLLHGILVYPSKNFFTNK